MSVPRRKTPKLSQPSNHQRPARPSQPDDTAGGRGLTLSPTKMLTEQAHYEAGMEEADCMASETDDCCQRCGAILHGWEVEEDRTLCLDCDPPDYEPTVAEVEAAGEWEEYPF